MATEEPLATGLEFADRQSPELQHVPPIVDLENRESSVSVVGRILYGFVLLSDSLLIPAGAGATRSSTARSSMLDVTNLVDL